MITVSKLGVSVVLCCHNSATRLPITLNYLISQEIEPHIPWEVIVIDNASTDETAQLALSIWPEYFKVSLRVVKEPNLGLSHARKRGFEEACYEFVNFVDDDNWVAPNWVSLVFKIMTSNPQIGACGGQSDAVFEVEPSPWFKKFEYQFAIGQQTDKFGNVTDTLGHLWGAGLTIRKEAWLRLSQNGFEMILSGRKGSALTSGEDYEICFALRLSGWMLWYSPDLHFYHFIPKNRITWEYLRKLNRGHGATKVGFEPYSFAIKGLTPNIPSLFGRIWVWQALKTTVKLLIWHSHDWLFSIFKKSEGNIRILRAEHQLGHLTELLRKRKEYDYSINRIWSAKWRQQ